MTKFTHEQRMKAVLEVVENHMSCNSIGKQLGCGETLVRRWVKRYEQFGVEGIILKHGTYSGEFKQHVVEYMHEKNLSLFVTAALFGIPNGTTVANWERLYYEEGPQALYRNNRGRKKNMQSDRKIKENSTGKIQSANQVEEDLISEVQRLRMENEYLKKLNALVQERIVRENGKK